MKSVPAYILAGGRSSRFGSDKALARIAGVPLVQRLSDQLTGMGCAVTVVSDQPDKYVHLGLTTVADLEPGLGPLGGLAAALAHRKRGWLLLVSCDCVLIEPAWVKLLLAGRRRAAKAVAFCHQHWEPMPGLYHTALARTVSRQLAQGHGALWRLLVACRAVALPLPPDWQAILHFNTPAQLRKARESLARRRR